MPGRANRVNNAETRLQTEQFVVPRRPPHQSSYRAHLHQGEPSFAGRPPFSSLVVAPGNGDLATSLRLVNDYARAWSAERGRCHRFVDGYGRGGQPLGTDADLRLAPERRRPLVRRRGLGPARPTAPGPPFPPARYLRVTPHTLPHQPLRLPATPDPRSTLPERAGRGV